MSIQGARVLFLTVKYIFFDEKPHVYQFLSSFPAVRKGERVSVFYEDETMSLVISENATVGWLPSDIIE